MTSESKTVAALTVLSPLTGSVDDLEQIRSSVVSQKRRPDSWIVVVAEESEKRARAICGEDAKVVVVVSGEDEGATRDSGVKACLEAGAEVIVHFSPGTYYPSTRVGEAVDALQSGKGDSKADSGFQLAVCNEPYFYDALITSRLLQQTGMRKGWGPLSSFAYTREYAESHRFAKLNRSSDSDNPEEVSEDNNDNKPDNPSSQFTGGFAQPAALLRPRKSGISVLRSSDTDSDLAGLVWMFASIPDFKLIKESSANLLKLFEKNKRAMKAVVGSSNSSNLKEDPADLTIVCGMQDIDPLRPKSEAERALVALAESARRDHGKTVRVYSLRAREEEEKEDDDDDDSGNRVQWRSMAEFDPHRKDYRTLYAWSRYGALALLLKKRLLKFKAETFVVDLHERLGKDEAASVIAPRLGSIDALLLKSPFHLRAFVATLPEKERAEHTARLKKITRILPRSTLLLSKMQNDEEDSESQIQLQPARDNRSFLFVSTGASTQMKTLETILTYFFPTVRELLPEANARLTVVLPEPQLENLPEETSRKLRTLLSQPGVTLAAELLDLRARCGFHLHFTGNPSEVDDSFLADSCLAGCLPLLAPVNLFAQVSGIHLKGNARTPKGYMIAARAFARFLRDTPAEDLDTKRRELAEAVTKTQAAPPGSLAWIAKAVEPEKEENDKENEDANEEPQVLPSSTPENE